MIETDNYNAAPPISLPCTNCGETIYQSMDRWYHLNTGGRLCISPRAQHQASTTAVSSSRSYTLAEWQAQVFDYCDEWERETESSQTEFRLMLSLMFESLGKKERERNERDT